MEYESQALFGGTIVQKRVFEATSIDTAKQETRKWLVGLKLSPAATQVILLRGGNAVWASALPELPMADKDGCMP